MFRQKIDFEWKTPKKMDIDIGHRKLSTKKMDDNKGVLPRKFTARKWRKYNVITDHKKQMLVQIHLHARIQGNINFGEIKFDTITTMTLGVKLPTKV